MVSVPDRRERWPTRCAADCRGAGRARCRQWARSALNYRLVKAVSDAPVLARMAALGAQYPRFSYRRVRIFLDREGHAVS